MKKNCCDKERRNEDFPYVYLCLDVMGGGGEGMGVGYVVRDYRGL